MLKAEDDLENNKESDLVLKEENETELRKKIEEATKELDEAEEELYQMKELLDTVKRDFKKLFGICETRAPKTASERLYWNYYKNPDLKKVLKKYKDTTSGFKNETFALKTQLELSVANYTLLYRRFPEPRPELEPEACHWNLYKTVLKHEDK